MPNPKKKTRKLLVEIDATLYDRLELHRVKLSSERGASVTKREIVEKVLASTLPE